MKGSPLIFLLNKTYILYYVVYNQSYKKEQYLSKDGLKDRSIHGKKKLMTIDQVVHQFKFEQ